MERLFPTRWDATVKQCQKKLEPYDLEQVELITTWGAMQKEIQGKGIDNVEKPVPYEIALIEPIFGHFRQFTEIFESQLGLSTDFFWGIIGLLVRLTSEHSQALQKIPRMLKSLGYKADDFKGYHASVVDVVLSSMKEACFDIQVQLVEFFTAAVKAVRDGGDAGTWGYQADEANDPWIQLQRRFITTQQDVAETLARVEKLVSYHSGPEQSSSAIASPQPRLRCRNPGKKVARFFDRVDVFKKIDQALGGEGSSTSFRAVALYGLGGIGKSSIGARYLETRFENNEYDTAFWIHGQTEASMRQSFTEIAMWLKLDGAKPNLHAENLMLVQNWLQSTDSKWLLVYDNVEEKDILMDFWPDASHGKVIITTRNHSLAYEPATNGIEIHSWDEKWGSEFLLFLLQESIGRDIRAAGNSATELAKRLDGHALAISHMAGLIHRRKWSITEFMRIYLQNPRRAHDTELQALWHYSFSSLNPQCKTFLGIASFLVSETIPQFLFEFEDDEEPPEDLEFCSDEFSFSEITDPLLTLSLIKRDRDVQEFSCHRMVQTQFRFSLSVEERQKAFNNAVFLVYRAFPKQSDATNENQLYRQWTQCNRCLQHVLSLKDHFKEDKQLAKGLQTAEFCHLLKDCSRYLYESNALKDLEEVCEVSLEAVKFLPDKAEADDLTAWTLSLQASMYESIGKVHEAIELNLRGYEIRQREVPLKGGLLGGFEQNLGYNYNTANAHEKALEWFEKSRDTWIAWNIKEEFKKERELNWAMFAYAYFVQGTIYRRLNKPEPAEASFMEAQNLWMRGDQTRLHPFHAGCVYKTGVVCLDQGKVEAAVKHLRDSLEITKFHAKVMPVEYARNLFKLSEALGRNLYENSGDLGEVADLRDEAEVYLLRRNPDAADFTIEDEYDRWVPIFWR